MQKALKAGAEKAGKARRNLSLGHVLEKKPTQALTGHVPKGLSDDGLVGQFIGQTDKRCQIQLFWT